MSSCSAFPWHYRDHDANSATDVTPRKNIAKVTFRIPTRELGKVSTQVQHVTSDQHELTPGTEP